MLCVLSTFEMLLILKILFLNDFLSILTSLFLLISYFVLPVLVVFLELLILYDLISAVTEGTEHKEGARNNRDLLIHTRRNFIIKQN